MKYHLLVVFFTFCFSSIFSQVGSSTVVYSSAYEKEILTKENATNLELLMAMGPNASAERTQAVKEELDRFVNDIKSSGLMRASEVKLMKDLHRKVHDRFLGTYQLISPFNEIFETGKYNCVSATALFALILDELEIPYNIQEQPRHVYIMAYPETKAISVEMTALNDAYSMPSRKDISKAIKVLLELELTTQDNINKQGELQVYNEFYNTNGVDSLRQLAGIQYFNEAIAAVNGSLYDQALNAIYKSENFYNKDKVGLLKSELLMTLISDSKFDSLKDIGYLLGYSKLKKAYQEKVYFLYVTFVRDELVLKGNKDLVDSSYVLINETLTDTALAKKLSALYYCGLSDYYANAYNLKKQLEYAEKAYNMESENPAFQLMLIQTILQNLSDKYEGEMMVSNLDKYALKYPFLETHNLYLKGYFTAYAAIAIIAYEDDEDIVKGKKYFDLAMKTREKMSDPDVIGEELIGWLYAESAVHFIRTYDNEAALKILEEGLKYAPDHERLLARIDIVKSRMK